MPAFAATTRLNISTWLNPVSRRNRSPNCVSMPEARCASRRIDWSVAPVRRARLRPSSRNAYWIPRKNDFASLARSVFRFWPTFRIWAKASLGICNVRRNSETFSRIGLVSIAPRTTFTSLASSRAVSSPWMRLTLPIRWSICSNLAPKREISSSRPTDPIR